MPIAATSARIAPSAYADKYLYRETRWLAGGTDAAVSATRVKAVAAIMFILAMSNRQLLQK